jgi:site-specific DNA-cytosine methylase
VKWWPLTKPGEDYGDAVTRTGAKVKLWNHKKLSGDLPSKSLTATDMFKHWAERRTLTFREWKRLGSFPDDYHAKTDKIGKYMIGMSVPPKMTEQVARAVIDQWLNA